MTTKIEDLPRDKDGNLIVKELVKLPLGELLHHIEQYGGGDGRAHDMAKRDANARMGRTQADIDLAYENGLLSQMGVYTGYGW